ncbi:uncharacterized protein EDB91DRAFT_1083657 [Suillus paluster]|uniref:uncharacterized protein n=1 Tax=Suillus paluster TaxID=48578 RepID=UPI001B86C1E4|nr:uncharacterized protein EDB91DRAFT_1083657 [Suillus paluster]KAG1735568.1 hypothetical protein EDB91DRAFT_1083657 [Suillus paluster]
MGPENGVSDTPKGYTMSFKLSKNLTYFHSLNSDLALVWHQKFTLDSYQIGGVWLSATNWVTSLEVSVGIKLPRSLQTGVTRKYRVPHYSDINLRKFKTQGFKKHEVSCKKCKDTEAEQAVFIIQYDKIKGKNAPPTIGDHDPLADPVLPADNLDTGNFKAYDGNYDRNFKGANSPASKLNHNPQFLFNGTLNSKWSTILPLTVNRSFKPFRSLASTHPEEELPME